MGGLWQGAKQIIFHRLKCFAEREEARIKESRRKMFARRENARKSRKEILKRFAEDESAGKSLNDCLRRKGRKT